MTSILVVEPDAEEDILLAYRWYEDRRVGYGAVRGQTGVVRLS